jgi:hypothetical protein
MAAAVVTFSLFWELNPNKMLWPESGSTTTKKKAQPNVSINVHLTRHEATHSIQQAIDHPSLNTNLSPQPSTDQ